MFSYFETNHMRGRISVSRWPILRPTCGDNVSKCVAVPLSDSRSNLISVAQELHCPLSFFLS